MDYQRKQPSPADLLESDLGIEIEGDTKTRSRAVKRAISTRLQPLATGANSLASLIAEDGITSSSRDNAYVHQDKSWDESLPELNRALETALPETSEELNLAPTEFTRVDHIRQDLAKYRERKLGLLESPIDRLKKPERKRYDGYISRVAGLLKKELLHADNLPDELQTLALVAAEDEGEWERFTAFLAKHLMLPFFTGVDTLNSDSFQINTDTVDRFLSSADLTRIIHEWNLVFAARHSEKAKRKDKHERLRVDSMRPRDVQPTSFQMGNDGELLAEAIVTDEEQPYTSEKTVVWLQDHLLNHPANREGIRSKLESALTLKVDLDWRLQRRTPISEFKMRGMMAPEIAEAEHYRLHTIAQLTRAIDALDILLESAAHPLTIDDLQETLGIREKDLATAQELTRLQDEAREVDALFLADPPNSPIYYDHLPYDADWRHGFSADFAALSQTEGLPQRQCAEAIITKLKAAIQFEGDRLKMGNIVLDRARADRQGSSYILQTEIRTKIDNIKAGIENQWDTDFITAILGDTLNQVIIPAVRIQICQEIRLDLINPGLLQQITYDTVMENRDSSVGALREQIIHRFVDSVRGNITASVNTVLTTYADNISIATGDVPELSARIAERVCATLESNVPGVSVFHKPLTSGHLETIISSLRQALAGQDQIRLCQARLEALKADVQRGLETNFSTPPEKSKQATERAPSITDTPDALAEGALEVRLASLSAQFAELQQRFEEQDERHTREIQDLQRANRDQMAAMQRQIDQLASLLGGATPGDQNREPTNQG